MKILIVDDESLARDRLKRLVLAIYADAVIFERSNGRDALLVCNEWVPDIVLIDVRMPVMDGIVAAQHFSEMLPAPAIIFTTAYEDHALEAFNASAIDYLIKPIDPKRLQTALDKAQKLNRSQMEVLHNQQAQEGARSQISCHAAGKIKLVALHDIYYFQAEDKYTVIYHQDGQELIEDSLNKLEEEFALQFIRIHRKTLVAKKSLIGMDKNHAGCFQVSLQGVSEPLEVSRRCASEVRKMLA